MIPRAAFKFVISYLLRSHFTRIPESPTHLKSLTLNIITIKRDVSFIIFNCMLLKSIALVYAVTISKYFNTVT